MFCRFYLGLGTPALSMTHPTIEYLFKPNQEVSRFGNRIFINQYGMRTDNFPPNKEAGELRIMVFGDSVINGGNLTDHSQLATTLVQQKLSKTNGKVIVGNISAGSWGPGNWLAYAKEYGFFGADVVVLVASSHDYADTPTFEALNKWTHPTGNPLCALYEAIMRYVPRYLPTWVTGGENIEADAWKGVSEEQRAQEGLRDLREFLVYAKSSKARVIVLQHVERSELESGSLQPGAQRIKEISAAVGVSAITMEPYFRRSLQEGGDPYRDNIHPNQLGQQLIADALTENAFIAASQTH